MRFVFRKVRKAKWYPDSPEEWLSQGHFQADALFDLKPEGRGLSIFVFNTDDDLRRIEAAYAAARDHLSNLDYALFDFALIEKLGLKTETTFGDTSDDQVNAFHRDIVHLTGHKLYELALLIFAVSQITSALRLKWAKG